MAGQGKRPGCGKPGWLMATTATGRLLERRAKAIMAVTAKRPLVVKRIGFSCELGECLADSRPDQGQVFKRIDPGGARVYPWH